MTAAPASHDAMVFAPGGDDSPRRRGTSGKMLLLGGCLVFVLLAVPVATGVAIISMLVLRPNPSTEDPKQAAGHDKADHGKHHSGGKESFAMLKDGSSKDGASQDGNGVKPNDKKFPIAKDKGKPKEKYGAMPRRALLINVCNYLYLNRVDHGKSQTSLSALKNHGISNAPLNIPPSQIFTLSDEGDEPKPTEVSVIKNAIKDFLDTSRPQDRIVILFAGHATEVEKDCYLVPIGGRKDNIDTLLPLAWVLSEMAACKAQQKVLILDVFRFPPARGFELPGAGTARPAKWATSSTRRCRTRRRACRSGRCASRASGRSSSRRAAFS